MTLTQEKPRASHVLANWSRRVSLCKSFNKRLLTDIRMCALIETWSEFLFQVVLANRNWVLCCCFYIDLVRNIWKLSTSWDTSGQRPHTIMDRFAENGRGRQQQQSTQYISYDMTQIWILHTNSKSLNIIFLFLRQKNKQQNLFWIPTCSTHWETSLLWQPLVLTPTDGFVVQRLETCRDKISV